MIFSKKLLLHKQSSSSVTPPVGNLNYDLTQDMSKYWNFIATYPKGKYISTVTPTTLDSIHDVTKINNKIISLTGFKGISTNFASANVNSSLGVLGFVNTSDDMPLDDIAEKLSSQIKTGKADLAALSNPDVNPGLLIIVAHTY